MYCFINRLRLKCSFGIVFDIIIFRNHKGKKIMRFKSVILFILIGTNFVFSQFSKNIEISSYFDDNLYRSPYPISDLFTTLDINLAFRPGESRVNFSYDGSFFLYQEANERNFSLHGLGISYFNTFGAEEEHTYYFGLDGLLRRDSEEYNYYDYNQAYIYANIRFDLNYLFLKTGYNFRHRNYANLSYLTNNRHYGYIQINKPFQTRTTIILESDLGQKSFSGQEIYSTTTSDGRGQGGMNNPSSSTSITTYVPSLSHIILLARLAQSLHDKFGLYVQYRRQINLSDQIGVINSEGYYQDEELYDDPFSYESEGLSSQLTWILPWSMRMQVGGTIISKNYISEEAYVSAEDTLAMGGQRVDEQNYYYLNFSKSFYLNKSWLNLLRINLYYNYIKNDSNSYWYTYKNHVLGGGIQWNF
jgi:hypothetical protein